MTSVQAISATLESPVEVLDEAPTKDRRAGAAGILFATLTFLAVSAFALYSSWEVGIPILVAVSVASVLITNRAVCTGLTIDQDTRAIERMLLENEKDYERTLTGIDAEWMLLTERIRAFVETTAQPVFRRVMAPPHEPSLATGTRRPAQLAGAGNAARQLSDQLHVLLAAARRNRTGRSQ